MAVWKHGLSWDDLALDYLPVLIDELGHQSEMQRFPRREAIDWDDGPVSIIDANDLLDQDLQCLHWFVSLRIDLAVFVPCDPIRLRA
jgi:hypothetical protein